MEFSTHFQQNLFLMPHSASSTTIQQQRQQQQQQQIIPAADLNQIVRLVQRDYVDSLRKSEPSKVAHLYRKDAIVGCDYTPKGRLLCGGDGADPPQITARLDVMGVTPETAVVRVDMETGVEGFEYTDYHTVIKYGGEWCIISRTYYASS